MRRRWFEAERLPIRRLDVLEVVGREGVVLVKRLGKDNERVADEEVSDVVREWSVDPVIE